MDSPEREESARKAKSEIIKEVQDNGHKVFERLKQKLERSGDQDLSFNLQSEGFTIKKAEFPQVALTARLVFSKTSVAIEILKTIGNGNPIGAKVTLRMGLLPDPVHYVLIASYGTESIEKGLERVITEAFNF